MGVYFWMGYGIGTDQILSSSLLHGAIPEKLWDLTGVSIGENMGNVLVNILPMKVYDMTVMNPMIASGLRWWIMLLILTSYLVKLTWIPFPNSGIMYGAQVFWT